MYVHTYEKICAGYSDPLKTGDSDPLKTGYSDPLKNWTSYMYYKSILHRNNADHPIRQKQVNKQIILIYK
jgi:hypothetical protein